MSPVDHRGASVLAVTVPQTEVESLCEYSSSCSSLLGCPERHGRQRGSEFLASS